jgi:hypothetical protein
MRVRWIICLFALSLVVGYIGRSPAVAYAAAVAALILISMRCRRAEPQTLEQETSWFWCGRVEGAAGGYNPPALTLQFLLYWLGNLIGRRFGPPRS